MQSSAGRKPDNVKKAGEAGPPDGPARVVKPGDWGAVPETAMKGFPMSAFSVPGRAAPKPLPAETKLAELTQQLRRAEEAHRKAIAKSRMDGEQAARAAEAKGREQGLHEGESRAWDRYEKALAELQDRTRGALEALAQEKQALFLGFEEQAVALAAACIRRVFQDLADEHAEAVLPLLKQAVAALGETAALTIKINPQDFKTVDGNRDFWLPVEAGLKDIRIIADDRIPKGGCFVESDSTSVGMQAEELAARIGEEMRKVFEARLRALGPSGGEME